MSYTASWVPIIIYCLGLFLVINNYVQNFKYVQSLRNIDIYLITKFHDSMLYGFLLVRVEEEGEEEEEEDEQNSLS